MNRVRELLVGLSLPKTPSAEVADGSTIVVEIPCFSKNFP